MKSWTRATLIVFLFATSVMPADGQRAQDVRIVRRRTGQLTASQFLKVDVSFRVGISRQLNLRRRFRRASDAGAGTATETEGHC